MARYFLHAGPVKSEDGDTHHVSCQQLAQLYGVYGQDVHPVHAESDLRGVYPQAGDVHLYPREDGNYVIPAIPSEH